MNRYYFNVETPSGSVADQEGTSLPSHQKAAELAEASMRELIAAAFMANRPAPCAIRVVDDFGRVVTEATAKQIADRVLEFCWTRGP